MAAVRKEEVRSKERQQEGSLDRRRHSAALRAQRLAILRIWPPIAGRPVAGVAASRDR